MNFTRQVQGERFPDCKTCERNDAPYSVDEVAASDSYDG